MQEKPNITLLICSHNRANTLQNSLKYYAGLKTSVPYEILIVVNSCTDHTLDIIHQEMNTNKLIRYVTEDKIGHSNARNTGFKNALAPFVFYVDDDAKPHADLLHQIDLLLSKNDINCISGRTLYWNHNSPSWIKAKYVVPPIFRADFGELPSSGYINGCACGFSVKALEIVGGFNTNLGMRAKKIGYYDEVDIQNKIKSAGYVIYYSPHLKVDHQSHYKRVHHFLNSAYQKGVYRKRAVETSSVKSFVLAGLLFLKGLVFLPYFITKNGLKSALVECFSIPCTYLGQV